MPSMLPKLIEDINALDTNNKITCIVATINMGWALEVGRKLGIKCALLFPASATTMGVFDNYVKRGKLQNYVYKKQEFLTSVLQ
ncbi:hypothetical protein Ahy_A04g017545 [Arachis hypogaea]|uniref:Uncharacterized protein n=1 Tax=Arachis hypogaea TaxID=3818 RepID=A0A445DBC8_ARAHY|nr:hypothetical protein Ahy_A04g017545 [Arachis hypogaea]